MELEVSIILMVLYLLYHSSIEHSFYKKRLFLFEGLLSGYIDRYVYELTEKDKLKQTEIDRWKYLNILMIDRYIYRERETDRQTETEKEREYVY